MDEQKLRDILGQDLEVPDIVNRRLENTYAQVKENQSPAKPRGSRPVRMVLIAAALAVGCFLSLAAGVPARVFHLAAGGIETYAKISNDHSVLTQIGGSRNPIAEEDGRLWLTIKDGEQHIDITDLVDADTPYIYDNTDPETGYRDYLIVGGTPGDYGWVEYYEVEDNSFAGTGRNTYTEYATIDGVTYTLDELTPEQRERTEHYVWNNDEGVKIELVNRPWHDAAIEQLGIY